MATKEYRSSSRHTSTRFDAFRPARANSIKASAHRRCSSSFASYIKQQISPTPSKMTSVALALLALFALATATPLDVYNDQFGRSLEQHLTQQADELDATAEKLSEARLESGRHALQELKNVGTVLRENERYGDSVRKRVAPQVMRLVPFVAPSPLPIQARFCHDTCVANEVL